MVKSPGRNRFEYEKKFTLGYAKGSKVFKGAFIYSKICLSEKSSNQELQGF